MKIGVCLPYLKAGVTREDYMAWFKCIDEVHQVIGSEYDRGC